MDFEVPAAIAEHVTRWAGGEPAPARPAATVALLRDGDRGPEVFLLHRLRAMTAFGGMTVFPGGSVDPADALDPGAVGSGHWPAQLSAEPGLARALVCAAARELFEEAGVLLASPAPADVHTWTAERAALEARELSFSTFLADRGLTLRGDLLRPWAHWITPVQEPRRFDTRFFVAALPAGQRTVEHTGEAETVAWWRPADALAARERGEVVMVPPTAITLGELAAFGSVADVLAARRTVRPLLAELVTDGDVVRFVDPR